MKDVEYVVLRYISDPVRNEPLNLGVMVWDEEQCLIRFSDEAIVRQLKLAPWLDEDAFDGIQDYFEERLQEIVPDLAPEGMSEARDALFSRPFTAGKTLVGYSSLARELHPKPLTTVADELISRIVVPGEMRPEHRETSAKAIQIAGRKLKSFIKREKVIKNYAVQIGRVERRIPFFANSSSNTGLEARSITVKMSLRETIQRVDEVTYNSLQVLEADDVQGMVIFLPYPDLHGATPVQVDHATEHYHTAQSIITNSERLRLIKSEDEILSALHLDDPDPVAAD